MKQRYFSTIYWHFTGSPRGVDWSLCRRPKDILEQGRPKPPQEALEVLFQILTTKTLLATCTERISERLHTGSFCCVTDIPLMDLELHTRYYGKVAIGFAPDSIYFHRFTPVLYFPSDQFPRKAHEPNLSDDYGQEFIVDDFDKVDTDLFDAEELPDGKFRMKLRGPQLVFWGTEIESGKIDRFFANHLKITDFSPRIGDSFYQEREWRHIGNYAFGKYGVEALIVPQRLKKKLRTFLSKTEDFEDVCILTWEFLRSA